MRHCVQLSDMAIHLCWVGTFVVLHCTWLYYFLKVHSFSTRISLHRCYLNFSLFCYQSCASLSLSLAISRQHSLGLSMGWCTPQQNQSILSQPTVRMERDHTKPWNEGDTKSTPYMIVLTNLCRSYFLHLQCYKSRILEDSTDNCIIVPTLALYYREKLGPRISRGCFEGWPEMKSVVTCKIMFCKMILMPNKRVLGRCQHKKNVFSFF